jgi:hypothetical protein
VRISFDNLKHRQEYFVARFELLGIRNLTKGQLQQHHALVKVGLDPVGVHINQLLQLLEALFEELTLAEHQRLTQKFVIANAMVIHLLPQYILSKAFILLVVIERRLVAMQAE